MSLFQFVKLLFVMNSKQNLIFKWRQIQIYHTGQKFIANEGDEISNQELFDIEVPLLIITYLNYNIEKDCLDFSQFII